MITWVWVMIKAPKARRKEGWRIKLQKEPILSCFLSCARNNEKGKKESRRR